MFFDVAGHVLIGGWLTIKDIINLKLLDKAAEVCRFGNGKDVFVNYTWKNKSNPQSFKQFLDWIDACQVL